MPVNPAPNGPSTSVLAYNGDSPRGWNDPPTFAFSKSTGSRPKLDLRKRVSHQQALHGTPTHPGFNPSSPTTYGVNSGNEVTDRMASLSLNSPPVTTTGNVSALPQSSTPPLQPKILHTHHASAPPPVTMYTPQQPTTTHYHGHNEHHRSHSLPSLFMPAVIPDQTPQHGHVEPISTPDINSALTNVNPTPDPAPQAPGYLGQPLFALKDHSFEPVKTHNDSSVRSTAEICDHLDDHSQTQIFNPVAQHVGNGIKHSAPPMGHITPPQSATQTGRVSPFSKPARAISPHPAIPVAPPSNPIMPLPPSPLPVMPMAAPTFPAMPIAKPNHPDLAVPTMTVTSNNIPPPIGMSVTSAPSIHGVGSSFNHLTPHQPPPIIPTVPVGSTTPTPPRTVMSASPGSRSSGNTPRCLSPEDETGDVGDEEGLKATIDALNDVIQKYNLEKRICDDIAKKLNVMSKMWREGKLGKTVKSRMIKLAKALDDGDGEEAHHIHVSIIVDHVAEVNQWMVAVKRLISMVRHHAPSKS